LRIVGVQSSKFKVQSDNLKLKFLENIKKSIKLIVNSGVDFEFRTTVVPGLHDKKRMVKMARQLRKEVAQVVQVEKVEKVRWFLQNFQPKNCLDPEFNKIKPYSLKEMEEILATVQKYIPGVKLRGE